MKISKVVVAFSLIFLSKVETSKTNNRRKRANQDNFNILLNMYKLNPLKHSNVFKTFSNQVLLPRPGKFADLNLNTKESINEKQNRIDFKEQYREILHYSSPNKLAKGPLNEEDSKAESFNSGHLDNLLSYNQINFDEKSNDDADIFGNTFVSPKIANQRIKENIRDNANNANSIDLDPNIHILKKKRKHKNKRYHPNAGIVLA